MCERCVCVCVFEGRRERNREIKKDEMYERQEREMFRHEIL